jgi:hypothetical protein
VTASWTDPIVVALLITLSKNLFLQLGVEWNMRPNLVTTGLAIGLVILAAQGIAFSQSRTSPDLKIQGSNAPNSAENVRDGSAKNAPIERTSDNVSDAVSSQALQQITAFVIAGGGGTSSSSGFSLSGTIGQPVAAQSSTGNYTLASGFWNTLEVTGVVQKKRRSQVTSQ